MKTPPTPTLNQNDMEALAFEMIRITPTNHLETWIRVMHALQKAGIPEPWASRARWWSEAVAQLPPPLWYSVEELSKPVTQDHMLRYLRATKTALTYYNTQTLHAFADGCRTIAPHHPATSPLQWWQDAVLAHAKASFEEMRKDPNW